MKINFFETVLIFLFIKLSSSLNYYYISSNGKINSTSSIDGSMPNLANDTVAVMSYENNINITGYFNNF